jgi:hypothetical protein
MEANMSQLYRYKEYKIPKKKGFRKIVAPSKELLKYQRRYLKSLEKDFNKYTKEQGINHHFQGFLRGKSPVTAAKMHVGQTRFIQMDIKDFFDSVTKKHIESLSIFNCINTTEITGDSNLWHEDGYAAQGFATSPMLANLALIPFVLDLKRYFSSLANVTVQFHIYADDITISLSKTDYELERNIIAKVTELLKSYKFEVKPSKTRVRSTEHGYVRILGVNVGKTDMRIPRNVRRKLRAAKHAGNKHSQGGLTAWQNYIKRQN